MKPSPEFSTRYATAKRFRDGVRHLIEESFRYTCPGREKDFNRNNNKTVDETTTFTSLGEELANDLGGDFVTYYTPAEVKWANYIVTAPIPEDAQKAVLEMVQDREDTMHELLQASNYNDIAPQWGFEAASHGTPALWSSFSHIAQPIHFEVIPPHELLLTPGHLGYLDRFREKDVPANSLVALFQGYDVDLSEPELVAKTSKPGATCKVCWGFWLDWSDPGNPMWHCEITVDQKPVVAKPIVLGPMAGSCPILVGRFNPRVGMPWGRGPGIKALPDLRTLDKVSAPSSGKFDFSGHLTEGGTRPDAITGMQGGFRDSLGAMFAGAPDHIKAGLKVGSGYRSVERQQQLWEAALVKYGSPEAARKWVAPPGNSQHNHGNAADLKFASDETRDWVHANAGKYGLSFPLANEPWHVEAAGARGGTGGSTSNTSAPYQAPTMIREADGKLTARLYSPMGGEVVQASNAAAGVAYQSEMMLKGMGDLMGISEQFPLDAQGYQQAAQGYVDQIVDKAPEMFKADLRTSLEREAKQRTLGMMEEQHRDIRQRANNSSAALVDRWSDNLSSAIAGGNPDEIAAAQGELDGVLAAREALPGVSWTPEQSDNVRIKAADAAQTAIKARASEQNKTYKSAAEATVAAANAGIYAADETSWDNAEFAASNPDEYRKAKAAQTRRETMPGFTAAPAADRKAAITEIAAIPIANADDVATVNAFRDADKTVTKAFEDSPMDAANAYLPNKPPPIPNLTGDPKTVVAALQARADYANGLKASGHSKYTAFLTDSEAETLGAALGKDTPPEIKAAILGTLVAGFGGDAGKVLTEAKSNDPTTLYSGMLMARGGDQAVVESALRGQAMLDEGLVQAPSKAISVAAISTDIAAALSVVPEAMKAEGDILKFAIAIYASEARGVDPTSAKATELMKQAINKALGQSTNRRGQVTGGVQKIRGTDTLLPVGVAGEDVNGALDAAFEANTDTYWNRITSIGRVASYASDTLVQPDIWSSAGISSSKGSAPMMGGKPIDPRHYQNGNLRFVPIPKSGATAYRMEYVSQNGTIGDVLDASGNVYQFDMNALIEASAP